MTTPEAPLTEAEVETILDALNFAGERFVVRSAVLLRQYISTLKPDDCPIRKPTSAGEGE